MDSGLGNQSFYGNGKLLISGEYFVLDGALALAVPTRYGQQLTIEHKKSFSPCLIWESYDSEGNKWFEAKFDFWHFDLIDTRPCAQALALQSVLKAVRKQNTHFLREPDVQVKAMTKLDFPLNWGLGSSSTLIHNIAKWGHVSSFQLLFDTFGGSGYDVACAQSESPILYENKQSGPHWSPIEFRPPFADSLYFVYLGEKQSTKEAIELYRNKNVDRVELGLKLSVITREMVRSTHLDDFDFLVQGHEKIISEALGLPMVKDKLFSDYWGEMKSLGAWGGDFILATSRESKKNTIEYFKNKGYDTVFTFDELIRSQDDQGPKAKVMHLH